MQAVRRINPLGFYLLPAGEALEGDDGLFRSIIASPVFMDPALTFFRWVLIDSPPAIPVADILALKGRADATLLVARAGVTQREAIDETIRNLGADHIIGIILNGIEGLHRTYSKYCGYGGYGGRQEGFHIQVRRGPGAERIRASP